MSNFLRQVRNILLTHREIRSLRAALGQQHEQIYVLRREIEYISRYLKGFGDPLRELFVFLQPMKANEARKVRVGSPIDGGYIMLDDFESVTQAYSLGIGYEASWDMEMARKGIPVAQFDPTVTRAPERHPRLSFQQRAVTQFSELCEGDPSARRILKIDIEGHEWELLDSATEDQLRGFDQIVGEFHRFDRYVEPDYLARLQRVLEKLHRTHQLIHIHGNNYSADFWTGRSYLAVDLELTFASRQRYTFSETTETFPGELDYPCDPNRFDPPVDCPNI